jgi:excisionase family DNA binding protein
MDDLTVQQAAACLGVAGRTVRLWLETGTMAGQRLTPRMWVVPRTEVERMQRERPTIGRPPRAAAEEAARDAP